MSDDMPLFFLPYRQEEDAKHQWYKDIWAACHNGQSAALLSAFGLGRLRQYTAFGFSLSALYLDHSDTPLRLRQNMEF